MTLKRTNGIFLPYTVFFIIAIFLLALSYFGFSKILRTPLETLLVPPYKALYNIRLSLINNLKIVFDINLSDKLKKIDDYKSEGEILKTRILLLEEENTSLKKQLEAPLPPAWNLLPAQVLGYDRYLLIDKGARDKVEKNMAVVFENFLVGKIAEISEKTAKVILVTDPESKIPAKSVSNIRGLLIGKYGNEALFSRVLQKETLNLGEQIVSTGEEGLPPNILIGKISELNTVAGDVYKEAKVTLFIDHSALKFVYIISGF